MKKALIAPVLAALAAAFVIVGVPATADAGGHGSSQRQVSTCNSCKKPVYAYRQYAGRQSCGTPIYRWITRPHTGCSHRSHSSHRSSSSHRGHDHGSSSHYGSSRSRSYGTSSRASFGRSGFSISFGRGGSSCR